MVLIKLQEKGYVLIRKVMAIISRIYKKDYEQVVVAGQALISQFKIPSLYSDYSRYLAQLNIKQEVFGYEFQSPITIAAFEGHMDSIQFWLNLGCGGACLKTIKQHPSAGNARPRIQQTYIDGSEHLINAMGLPGLGVDAFLNRLTEIAHYNCPIGVSIGGNTIEEYEYVIDALQTKLHQLLGHPYIEFNISCPNTHSGRALHDSIDDIERLLKKARESCPNTMITIKVSPDASDQNLCDIASLAKSMDQVTINAGNTQYKKCQEVGLQSNDISIGGGGLSGPSLFNRTLEMVTLLSQFKLPLIATGGISNEDQIICLQEHGVKVVGMATQIVKNPFSIISINKALDRKRQSA